MQRPVRITGAWSLSCGHNWSARPALLLHRPFCKQSAYRSPSRFRWISTESAISVPRRSEVSQNKRYALFSEEEDAIILELRAQRKSWKAIHQALPHRTPDGLRLRWQRHVRPGLDFEKERLALPFSSADFETIARLRENEVPWTEIQRRYFPQRNNGNLRYYYHITRPSWGSANEDGKLPWSTEEDKLLLHLRGELELSWEQIHQRIPGRSAPALHMRYYRLKNRNLKRERATQENKRPQYNLDPHKPI